MRQRFPIIVFFSILIPLVSKTQTSNDTIYPYKNAIGITAGFSTGYGLAYLHNFNKFKIQVNFYPYHVDYFRHDKGFDLVHDWDGGNEYYEKRHVKRYIWRTSTGFTLFYRLSDNRRINLYLYQGNQWRYEYHDNISKDTIIWLYNDIPDTSHYFEIDKSKLTFMNNSLGLGLEIRFLKKATFHLMGGYGWYGRKKSLTWTGETGLFFNF